ncbi:alpha/beta fold hydrolase [Streptomyces paromomycinus]|nr:alpha/beta fold hydrolase [Streptomyces paromomycinus]
MQSHTLADGRGACAREVMVAGIRTGYLESGEGPPLLLLHGNEGTAHDWDAIAPAMAPGHRVIALHLPGFGITDPLPDARPERVAGFVWDFADTVGLGRPAVVGHSAGGLVALHAALQQPARVPRLVLIASAGLGRLIDVALVLKARTVLGDADALVRRLPGISEVSSLVLSAWYFRQPWRVPLSAWAYRFSLGHSRQFMEMSLQALRGSVGWTGQKSTVLPRLRELSMPVLVVWGALDNVIPAWQGCHALRHLPDGRLQLIPVAGHMPHLEASAEVLEALRPFVNAGSGGKEAGWARGIPSRAG